MKKKNSYFFYKCRGCLKQQKSCTCADPFSLACPLHSLQDSESDDREALRIMSRNHRENEEEDEGIQSENDEDTGLALQGPFCDCQVFWL